MKQAKKRRPRNGLFNAIAPVWDQLIGRWGLQCVLESLDLAHPMRILDLAGGTGRVAAALRTAGHQAVVADLSAPMARRAAKKGLSATVARAEALPFPDASFDRVVILDALHHMAELPAVAGELARLLAPDGRLVLFEPDPRTFIGGWVARLERWAGMGSLLLDEQELVSLLESVGLRCRNSHGSFHLLIVARRSAS